MSNSISISCYLTLILCSHLWAIAPLPASSHKDLKQLNPMDSAAQDDQIKLDGVKESLKRGWKDNTMQVWGKRSVKLNEPSSKILSTYHNDVERYNKLMNSDAIKRKWGQNNMPVWGKRDSVGAANSRDSEIFGSEELEKDKRKWGSNSMTVWGKRSDAQDESVNEYNKRKWGENSMTVWGKRAENPFQYSSPVLFKSKRKWGDNTMSVWGKRSQSDSDIISLESENEIPSKKLLEESKLNDPAVKRKWSDNTMQVWGKRKSSEPNSGQHHSISKRSVRRVNGEYEDITENDLWRSLAAESENSNNGFGWPKRNWETNTMRVWGKRSRPYRARTAAVEMDDDWQKGDGYAPAWYAVRLAGYREPEKRVWSSDNELRVWG